MIVSFLIPTRGRIQMLLEGIQSIKERTSPDVQLEFLVRIDQDDQGTLAGRDHIPGEIVIGPRWCGYDSIPVFINELAAKSHGDWIIPWNDDMFMKTSQWDRLLPPADRAQVIWLHGPGSWTWAFPAMTRKLYILWNCFAPGIPVDTCIFEMWKAAGKPIPNPNDHSNQIIVEHRRNEANILALRILPEDVRPPPPQNPTDNNYLVKLLRDAP